MMTVVLHELLTIVFAFLERLHASKCLTLWRPLLPYWYSYKAWSFDL